MLSATPRRPVDAVRGVRRTLKLTEDRHWLTPAVREDRLLWLRDVESRLISAHNVHVLLETLRETDPEVVYLANLVGLGGLGLVSCLDYLGIPWVWQLGDRIPVDLCTRAAASCRARRATRGQCRTLHRGQRTTLAIARG